MSQFKVTVEQIETVKEHPNADRLELATVKGLDFQFVVGKGTYQPGSKVIYFPVDSVLPESIQESQNLKLSKNRIRTISLRGAISQGLVIPAPDDTEVGDDLTEVLGVTKYEPPVQASNSGNLVGFYDGVSKYDIESTQRFPKTFQTMMDVPVVITEKIEGTNWGVHYSLNLTDPAYQTTVIGDDGALTYGVNVFQRQHFIMPVPGKANMYHNAYLANQAMFDSVLGTLFALGRQPTSVTIRGELAGPGIQKNIYKLQSHQVFVFDIQVNGQYLHYPLFDEITEITGISTAPVLFWGQLSDFLDGESIVSASTGKSKLHNTLREGIVIKPILEKRSEDIGRLILKIRSPEYLAKTGL